MGKTSIKKEINKGRERKGRRQKYRERGRQRDRKEMEEGIMK
jgi:hypothetical protein